MRDRTPGSWRGLPRHAPQVQMVISDGLNANALNEHLRDVAAAAAASAARRAARGDTDIVIENGRVRAGYHVGELIDAASVVHLIGERPGTGLDTLSAYITYGRDAAGRRAGAATWITPGRRRSAAFTRAAGRLRRRSPRSRRPSDACSRRGARASPCMHRREAERRMPS